MLKVPYALNILILVPVCWSLASGTAGVFQGKVTDSDGLRWLLFSLWSAILLGSVVGLFEPVRMAPLLGVQIVYKALWLALFVWPLWRAGGTAAIPLGITAVFIFIVVVWPWFLWAALRQPVSG